MKVLIVGGGQKVHYLIKLFIKKGYEVTVVNMDRDYARQISRANRAVVVLGDGTKPFVLEDAGVRETSVFIAFAPKDSDNLVASLLAKEMFKVKKTFAIVNDPANIEIFKSLGIDTVISTANIVSMLIERVAFSNIIDKLVPIEQGQVAMLELEVQEDYPIVNKKITEIGFPENAIIGCIIRENDPHPIIPRGNTKILTNDKLIILTETECQTEVIKAVTGSLDSTAKEEEKTGVDDL